MSKRYLGLIVVLIVNCQLPILAPLCSASVPARAVNNVSVAPPKPVKQKTLVAEAKAAIKNRRDQAKAKENLLAIVNREDITQAQRAEIYFMAEELERSMNGVENEKLYLKQVIL